MVDPTGLPPDLDISEDEDLTKSRLDRAFGWIATKIRGLESFQPSWLKEVETLRAFGLARINEAIMPAYNRVMKLASFGFLKADSSTSLVLEIDATRVFIITDENQRALFTPTEFVAITRIAAPDEWAIARVLSFDAQSGNLRVVILSVSVSPGAHDDWQITASAATLAAASKMLADTRKVKEETGAIKTDTDAIRLSAVAAKEAAEKAASDANAAALLIKGGPVTTVNGRNAAVELEQGDIPGLVEHIAGAATKDALNAAVSNLSNSIGGKASTASVVNLTNVVAGKVAFDGAQTLTTDQQLQARKNLGLYASAVSIGQRNMICNSTLVHVDDEPGKVGFMAYDGTLRWGVGWRSSGYIAGGNWYVACTTSGGTPNTDAGFGLISAGTDTRGWSPYGSECRIRVSNNVVVNSLGAEQYIHIATAIEGMDFAASQFGESRAKPLVFRFGLNSKYPGVYSIALRSKPMTPGTDYMRSRTMTVTVAPEDVGKDVYYTIAIPPDTFGVDTFWDKHNNTGVAVSLTAGCGSKYTTNNLNVWQPGNYIAHSSGTNFYQHTGVLFETFDWGLYVDYDNTGIAPVWAPASQRETAIHCSRYFTRVIDDVVIDQLAMYSLSKTIMLPVSMRASPSATITDQWYNWTQGIHIFDAQASFIRYRIGAAGTNALNVRSWGFWANLDARL